MSTIVLNSLDFVGDGMIGGGTYRFTERSAGVPAYFRVLTESVTANPKSGRQNILWKLELPFPETAPTDCPCPGQAPYLPTIVRVEIRCDGRADATYRAKIKQDIQDLVLTTQFVDSVTNLTPSG